MQLHAAAARGDLDGMAFALKCGAKVNALNSSGQTALVFALERAKAFTRRCGPLVTVDAVKFLLDAGADAEATDSVGSTAIHHAVAIADRAFLELLLERGANARHVTKFNYSVVTNACFQPSSSEKLSIVRRLHEVNASLDTMSVHGEFPLGVCLRCGDFGTMRLLLDLGASPGPLNWTPVHHAVATGNLSDLQRMAPSPAEINALNERYQLSPWLLAFTRGDLGIIRWLADQGADLTQTGRCGESLCQIAARFGHLAAIHWLSELGAKPDVLDEFGNSPLREASEWNHVECVAALIRLGAAVEGENQEQPIHIARSLETIKTLVDLGGADVNAIDGCGDWPLKLAAEDNDVKRIEWLLSRGAQVDRTSTGETALHAAVRADSREAVDLLLAAGANPNLQDVDGWTPLFCVQSRETIRVLRKAGADPKIADQIGDGPEKWLGDDILVKALREGL
jgi:uncharacterized protein